MKRASADVSGGISLGRLGLAVHATLGEPPGTRTFPGEKVSGKGEKPFDMTDVVDYLSRAFDENLREQPNREDA